MTRGEKHARIIALREQGLTHRQVAETLGMTRSAVRNLLNDPDGSKQRARRERYRGVCSECGARTDGSSGFRAPTLCAVCNGKATRVWTREKIIAAIQEWARAHGRPPRAHPDWTNAGPDHPARSTVYGDSGAFASWADAIEAAGFPRPQRGLHIHGVKWEQVNTVAALRNWADTHGRPPRYVDWIKGEPGRPTSVTVTNLFGSWTKALDAACLSEKVAA